ncbi:adenylylsulfate kinase [Clostridium sp. C105KSO13]|uniref:adenylylsulfate kinase n=1 Tax=Clostridium sp. C105KSO13 TaxID=1776045 RepID=UPI0007406954|nr:adenylylsulfate kinase [Clostridium sp. C105KSO13]CUX33306.1 hypothetical protein BN3456_01482 [Clostridium sp. C105KSO13]
MDYSNIPHGDMPGDVIKIEESHVKKANVIMPKLMEHIRGLKEEGKEKIVVSVCGGSGVGKSETASLLSYMLCNEGLKSYTMSGDNYPYRIPSENDNERLKVFEKGGREALVNYLGTDQEIDFRMVNQIIDSFKSGKSKIKLKRMGRSKDELWFEEVDFSDTCILMLEWTHGNSDYLTGIDVAILLNSTPKETLDHRKARNRDGSVDSPFTSMVLEIEQGKLKSQAHKAKIIVTKSGKIVPYSTYLQIME